MKRAKCPKCGYEWSTKSEMMWINCPNCRRGSKREDILLSAKKA